MRALVKLADQLERIRDRVAEIAKTVPLYTLREMAVAFAVATHFEPSVSENEIDRALREGGVGIGRPTLRATLADLKARGIVTNARVRQRRPHGKKAAGSRTMDGNPPRRAVGPALDSPLELGLSRPEPMSEEPARRPDPFVNAVSSIRDCVLHVMKVASWKLTLASGFALASRLAWPLAPDDAATHGLLGLTALSLGACIGREIDRKVELAKRR